MNDAAKNISDAGANTAGPMDERTLTALQGSIAKWQAIVDGTGADEGWTNCPLCVAFLHDDCDGCPVAQRAGEIVCKSTPYEEWAAAYEVDGQVGRLPYFPTPETLPFAQAELAFLQSLLP